VAAAAAAAAAAAVTSRSRTRTTPLRHRTVVSPDTRYTHSCTHHGPRGGRESLLSRMRMPGVGTPPPPRASSPVHRRAPYSPPATREGCSARSRPTHSSVCSGGGAPTCSPRCMASATAERWRARLSARRAPRRPMAASQGFAPFGLRAGVWPSTAAPGRLCTSGGTHWLPVSEHEARTTLARAGSGSARGERSPWKWGVHRQSRSRLSHVAHSRAAEITECLWRDVGVGDWQHGRAHLGDGRAAGRREKHHAAAAEATRGHGEGGGNSIGLSVAALLKEICSRMPMP